MKVSIIAFLLLCSSVVYPFPANEEDFSLPHTSDISFSHPKPDETVQTINLIIESIRGILGPPQPRSEIVCKYRRQAFYLPHDSAIRGLVDIAVDVEDIYWAMLKSESIFGTAGCRLQDLLFERLLLPDHEIFEDEGEAELTEYRIDRILKHAYDLLYYEPANGPQISGDRRRRLQEIKLKLLRLRAPISQSLYTEPFHVDIDALRALYEFVKHDVKEMILAWSPQVSEERLVTDILGGLKAILEGVRELAEEMWTHPST